MEQPKLPTSKKWSQDDGNPAIMVKDCRPVVLRRHLSMTLPFAFFSKICKSVSNFARYNHAKYKPKDISLSSFGREKKLIVYKA